MPNGKKSKGASKALMQAVRPRGGFAVARAGAAKPVRGNAVKPPRLATSGAAANQVVSDARMARKKRAARASELVALIAASKARIGKEFWVIGRALSELLRERLYSDLGHKSFRQMLEARKMMSLSTAKKLIAIAENVPENQAHELGTEKAYELVRLTASTTEKDSVSGLVDADASIGGQRVSQSNAVDVKEARQRVREEAPRTEAERRLVARRRAADARLREFLIAHGVARPAFSRAGNSWLVRLSLADVEALQ
jgi:hypothetical protein